jgi:membrane protein implicated in regulation of membrane protease activity
MLRRIPVKASTIITAIFLLLVSVGHLLRLIYGVQITANAVDVPMWVSTPTFIITAGLAIWLLADNRKRGS